MQLRSLFAMGSLAAALAVSGAVGAQTLNVVTAGDQNMVDYVNNYLGPKFEAMNPGVKVRAVGTGPGDGGSQKIYEKLSAQQKAGAASWDTDVAVVHQRGAATMVNEKLLMPYRNDIAAGKLVSRDSAKNALGANVDGYVLPMFHSQIAFAYNPDVVKAPPKSYAELAEWVKKNPKQFGYNGVKGGMSGVGFVMGWVGANSGLGDKLEKGPYSAGGQGHDRQVAREPQGLQPERRDDAGQRRHARHAEPRRDRDGSGVGRHVLYVGGRRQDEPEGQAVAAVARACRASRCTT